MNAYLYNYSCPGEWYGKWKGLRNIYTESDISDAQAIDLAKNDIQFSLGHKKCDVNLLVKYKLSIESVKTYAEILSLG